LIAGGERKKEKKEQEANVKRKKGQEANVKRGKRAGGERKKGKRAGGERRKGKKGRRRTEKGKKGQEANVKKKKDQEANVRRRPALMKKYRYDLRRRVIRNVIKYYNAWNSNEIKKHDAHGNRRMVQNTSKLSHFVDSAFVVVDIVF